MRNDVLSEYLSLVVERIRSQRGVKGLSGDRFDMKKFKSLPGSDQMIVYANKFLQKLGEGSSRIAFLMSGKYALKIALNQKGLSQNEAELDVCTNPASKAVVAKIYDFDDKHRWLISDLVREISNEAEFKSLTGVRWTEEFCVWTSHGIRMKKVPENLPDDMEIVRSTIKMAIANNLLPGDITKLEHWGRRRTVAWCCLTMVSQKTSTSRTTVRTSPQTGLPQTGLPQTGLLLAMTLRRRQ